MRRLPAALALVWFCVAALPGRAQFRIVEADDLRLIYPDPTLDYLAPYTARCFASALRTQKALFGYEPWEPVTVTLADFSDIGQANAGSLPRNNVNIGVAPMSFAYETLAPNERIATIMKHELVHVVAMDQAAKSERFFRRLFRGKVLATPDHPETIGYLYLTAPRVAVPSWFREGGAVFFETWFAGGIGRAQGAWDEMVFRSMVRDGTSFYDPLALVSEGTKVDFQATINAYLYGTRFLSYLALVHGPGTVVDWVSRRDGSERHYARHFEKVYGRPLAAEWDAWIAWEEEFQRRNLEAIRQYPVTSYTDVSPRALGSVSRAFHDPERRKLYAGFNHPGVVAHVGAVSLDDGSVDRVVEVKDPVLYTVTSLAWDPASRTLFYTSDNTAYRDLRAVDPVTKKSRLLIKDARIGDLVFRRADRSIWGIRQLNGLSSIVRVPPPYAQWETLYTFKFGEVPYDLDLSPDGTLLSASIAQVSGLHALRVMKLDAVAAGDVTPIAAVDFGTAIPSNFVFSPGGRRLFGSSYYSGVSNIFRYDLDTGKLDAVTNTETGFFRPVPLDDDGSLFVFRYTGKGFVPARVKAAPLEDVSAITFLGAQIADEHPVVRSWSSPSPASVPLAEAVRSETTYRPFRSIRLESAYPVVEGYKESWAAGGSANFSDPLGIHRATVTASYSPDSELPSGERLHASVKYRRYDWRADFRHNAADFYDLFGPTKTGRKGQAYVVGHKRTLILDSPREMTLDLEGAHYANLDRLPYAQNVAATFDRLSGANAQLAYHNLRSSIGAVDVEKGIKAEGNVGVNRVHGDLIPYAFANLDLGWPLPLDNSSVWARGSAGVSSGDPDDVFASFFFGGFGNNWVDHRVSKRYREFYAFPGVELNDIGGKNYAKAMVEWNLPPIRFRRVGTPGFYLTWARTSLFAGGIGTNWNDDARRRKVGNVGAQMDFRVATLSQLDLTLSIGYATAFERGADRRDEAMVSLKILR